MANEDGRTRLTSCGTASRFHQLMLHLLECAQEMLAAQKCQRVERPKAMCCDHRLLLERLREPLPGSYEWVGDHRLVTAASGLVRALAKALPRAAVMAAQTIVTYILPAARPSSSDSFLPRQVRGMVNLAHLGTGRLSGRIVIPPSPTYRTGSKVRWSSETVVISA